MKRGTALRSDLKPFLFASNVIGTNCLLILIIPIVNLVSEGVPSFAFERGIDFEIRLMILCHESFWIFRVKVFPVWRV